MDITPRTHHRLSRATAIPVAVGIFAVVALWMLRPAERSLAVTVGLAVTALVPGFGLALALSRSGAACPKCGGRSFPKWQKGIGHKADASERVYTCRGCGWPERIGVVHWDDGNADWGLWRRAGGDGGPLGQDRGSPGEHAPGSRSSGRRRVMDG